MSPIGQILSRLLRRGDAASLEAAALIEESGLFDSSYYLETYPDVQAAGVDPLRHYLAIGAAEGRNPNALFDTSYYLSQCPEMKSGMNPLLHYIKVGAAQKKSPNPLFDTAYYLDRFPDVAVSGMDPLLHYLRHGAAWGYDPSAHFDTSMFVELNPEVQESGVNPLAEYLRRGIFSKELEASLGALKKYYPKLRLVEPLLPPMSSLGKMRHHKSRRASTAGEAYFKLASLIDRAFTHLILMPGAGWGGSERVALNFALAIADRHGSDAPLVLCTDSNDRSTRRKLPADVRVICLDDLASGLSAEDKVSIVVRCVLQSKPILVHNLNSAIGWMSYRDYGRQLRSGSKLMACMFAYDQDDEGAPGGFSIDYFNHCADFLDHLFTDNLGFKRQLIERFALPPEIQERIIVTYSPVDLIVMAAEAAERIVGEPSSRPGVLWASRIDPIKRPDVLLSIARQMPEVDFHMCGGSGHGTFDQTGLSSQPNIILHGPYENFEQLPASKACLFLYTSERDGIPIVLLESIACGLPVIAPDVGGISEVITARTGWLISDFEDVDEYVAAVREALSSASQRLERAASAQELLLTRHSFASFVQLLDDLGDYL